MSETLGKTNPKYKEHLTHPFLTTPNKTLLGLSVPVFFSLIAEPLTGLVDTAFVSRLGASSLAALGVGTLVLSVSFWIFSFLGIGVQTQIAQASSNSDSLSMRKLTTVASALAVLFGLLMLVLLYLGSGTLSTAMGASGEVFDLSKSYIGIRALGAPAVILMLAIFGSLRGVQDMKSPFYVALGQNVVNVALDYPLIFGLGEFEGLGVAGAAWASVISQWLGAFAVVFIARDKIGFSQSFEAGSARKLMHIGGDIFIRSGMLSLFLLLTTRAATELGAEQGAAHQAVRQVWLFMALALDAFAIAGQSLVGYFFGAGEKGLAKRVAAYMTWWSVGLGVLISITMYFGTDLAVQYLIPPESLSLFLPIWMISLIAQPINAITFATDGVHWGTGDFAYLRNAGLISSLLGSAIILTWQSMGGMDLLGIWWIMTLWIVLRAGFGFLRIWPGLGQSRI